MKRRQNQRGKRSSSNPGEPHLLPLPHATRQVFSSRLPACRNVGLLFDRYLRFQDGWQLGTYGRKESAKLFNIQEIVKAQERCQRDQNWGETYSHFIERWKKSAQALGTEPFPLSPTWRFVVGLGDKGALEAGLIFHRIYGFPYIPGSTLKGLARGVALSEIAEALNIPILPLQKAKERAADRKNTPLEKLETLLLVYDERVKDSKQRRKMHEEKQKALDALDNDKEISKINLEAGQLLISHFRIIFGTLYAAGQAIFLDGVSSALPTLEPDVMNVHYQDYYSGNKDAQGKPIPPADYLNPNPIPFLTIGKETQFLFAVGRRGEKDKEAQQQAEDWLKYGLKEFGVGAKTSAGYGYFSEVT